VSRYLFPLDFSGYIFSGGPVNLFLFK
jgi:hypothetical protein